jgi:hypothetical protein
MKINTVAYSGKDQNFILINGNVSMSWPSGNYPSEHIQEWLAAGNEIAPYEPPALSVEQQRQQAYLDAGITTDAMIVALWERDVEGRPEALNKIESQRQLIKQEFPK